MSETQSVVIERVVDAPVALVWQMWTESEHFAAWYGPQGARIPTADMDVQVGGRRHICMEMDTPNGPMQMWMVGEYREISPTDRLVYTESMSNEAGDVIDPASVGMEGHPAVTEIIVELSDANGKTRMVMTHAGIPADSPGAMGWNMALDKLEAHVATI